MFPFFPSPLHSSFPSTVPLTSCSLFSNLTFLFLSLFLLPYAVFPFLLSPFSRLTSSMFFLCSLYGLFDFYVFYFYSISVPFFRCSSILCYFHVPILSFSSPFFVHFYRSSHVLLPFPSLTSLFLSSFLHSYVIIPFLLPLSPRLLRPPPVFHLHSLPPSFSLRRHNIP